MAVSLYNSYKLLNAWQRVMLEAIWQFNQSQGQGAPDKFGRSVYIQPERDDIAQQLAVAVETTVQYLGFYPRPVYVTERISLQRGVPLELQTLKTAYKHLQAFGSRAATLVQAAAPVVFSDVDGDGVNDTATVTIPNQAFSSDEIHLFFQVSDGAPGAADDLYEIEPTIITVGAVNTTIKVHKALLVKPNVFWDIPYNIVNPNMDEKNYADSNDDTDFVATVDVYRIHTTATGAVNFVYDNFYFNGSSDATETQVAGAGLIKDSRNGIFMVRPTSACYSDLFEAVEVQYLAGLSLVRGRMNTVAERAFIRLANANMPHEPAAFAEPVNSRWTYDHTPAANDNLLTPLDLKNPFGIRRGHVDAWRDLSSLIVPGGGKIT